jgi:streptomycin 6-kinase
MTDDALFHLPESVTANARQYFRDAADRWASEFPRLLSDCVDRWDLSLEAISPHMSFNFIVFALDSSARRVVLKMGVPHPEQRTEMEALRHYAGRGCVECLGAAPELGALLMNRVVPGTMLLEMGDDESQAAIAAKAMSALTTPVPQRHALPAFGEQLRGAIADVRAIHGNGAGPLPERLFALVGQVWNEIEKAKPADVLLHGDLHHENLLYDNDRGWVAIDPKGVIGAPILQVGRFMWNRLPDDEAAMKQTVQRRSEILAAEINCGAKAVLEGALVDSMLSTCWSVAGRRRRGGQAGAVREASGGIEDNERNRQWLARNSGLPAGGNVLFTLCW